MIRLAASLLCLVLMAPQAPADDAPASKPDAAASRAGLNDRLLALCRKDTEGYRLTSSDEPARPLVSREVLKWTNPVRDGQIGVVHGWLRDGRVEAVSSVFNGPVERGNVQIMHEFVSLSTGRLGGQWNGKTVWQPARAGFAPQLLEKGDRPEGTRPARLRQIRTLAREFSAHSLSPYADKSRWELRMLPQPLYRYDAGDKGDGATNADVLDGALFAFVSTAGTDPELLLVIEARRVSGEWRWEFGGGRFSDNSLFLEHGGKTVWEYVNQTATPTDAAGETDTYRLRTDRIMSESELMATSPAAAAAP